MNRKNGGWTGMFYTHVAATSPTKKGAPTLERPRPVERADRRRKGRGETPQIKKQQRPKKEAPPAGNAVAIDAYFFLSFLLRFYVSSMTKCPRHIHSLNPTQSNPDACIHAPITCHPTPLPLHFARKNTDARPTGMTTSPAANCALARARRACGQGCSAA